MPYFGEKITYNFITVHNINNYNYITLKVEIPLILKKNK